MLFPSQQYSIIQSMILSYDCDKEKFPIKVSRPSEKVLERFKKRYPSNKYETWSLTNFKLLLIYIIYELNKTSSSSVFKALTSNIEEDFKLFLSSIKYFDVLLYKDKEYLYNKFGSEIQFLDLLKQSLIKKISIFSCTAILRTQFDLKKDFDFLNSKIEKDSKILKQHLRKIFNISQYLRLKHKISLDFKIF